MSVASEFPALYAVSKMYPAVIEMIGNNLENYSVDVRIDYERWIQFQKEYGEWADSSSTRDTASKRLRQATETRGG